MIETVGVVGLGLIGGSMAKAIRQYTDCTILGYDTDGAVLSRALDEGVVSAIPEVTANCLDAQLVHEAAIGKIAGEQLVKLMTLGLTEAEAEAQIVNGFLK